MTNAERIKQDALIVYDYLTQVVGVKEENIIIMGRSMGTGPASEVARVRHPHAVILVSPFESLVSAIKNHLGWASVFFNFYENDFNNL